MLKEESQFTSVMNNTKWRELAAAFTSSGQFKPCVRVRELDGFESGFTQYDWECMRLGSSSHIEWMDIDPIKKERQGALVADKETDFSEFVVEQLRAYSIPYSIEEGYYRVWGYINAENQPEFV